MTDTTSLETIELLARVRNGDKEARDRLLEQSLPPLRRWARRRLPPWARGLCDTQDLVQDAALRVLPRLATFVPTGPGAFQQFLRKAVQNRMLDEVRRAYRRPTDGDDVLDGQPDRRPSPLEQAIVSQGMERYEAALAALTQEDEQAVRARMEQDLSYAEIASALGKPSPDAARMAVNRALARLLTILTAPPERPDSSR